MQCRKCKEEIDNYDFCPHCGAKQSISSSKRTRPNGMGTAFRRGKSWMAEVVVGYNPETARPIRKTKGGFKTKRDALEYIPTLKNPLSSRPEYTLSHYHELWYNTRKISSSKDNAYRIAWKKWDELHHSKIQDVDIATLQRIINQKAKTYYPAKDMRQVMKHLYDLAIPDGQAAVNLAEYIKLPELKESEPEAFSESELKSLWSAYESGDTFIGYILLMIYTGMMPGELMKLKKDMIDWEANEIVGAGIKTKERKSKPIVLADFIIPVLQTICDNTRGEKVLRMNKDNFYKKYYEAIRRSDCRPLPPYSCRHTTATALALANKVAPSVIQRVMRHAKFTTTQRYIHPKSDDAIAAVNTLAPTKEIQ